MNKKRLIKFLLPIAILMVLVGGWNILRPKPCTSDGTRVCFIETTGTYAIEEGAQITVQVPSKAYGDALMQLFINEHPESEGVLSVVLSSEIKETLPDLSYLTQNEAAIRYASLIKVDPSLIELWENNLQWDKSNELNKEGLRFIPMAGNGFSF
ncbi:MAG: hypothetical protein E4G74_02275, partial [Erysipelotrichales bacterium]